MKKTLCPARPADSCAAAASDLDRIFADPPQGAGLYVWWHWQGSNVTKYGITRDFEAMKRAGVASAAVVNIKDVGWDCWYSKFLFKDPLCPGMKYMNERWFEMFKFAISEAKRLGLSLGLHNCPGFSTSGGPWITPELGMKKLVWAKGDAMPETVLGFYRDIAKVETSDGAYRFGYTCTGKCTHPSPPEIEDFSLEADKMSLKAIDFHLDNLLGNLASNGISASNPGLSFIYMDSYEAGDFSWTDDFAEEFRLRRGYDPIPFLPVLASLGTSAGAEREERFRRDFTRTKHELQTERHYKRFQERLNAAGYEFHLEPYTGSFDSFEAAQYCDVPMTEFWEGKPFWGGSPYPGGAAWMCGPVGRALGRNIVGAEAFTGYPLDDPFAITPRDLKRSFDATMARGVNRLSLHHWAHQPLNEKWKPGFSMGPWGTHFGENQTWFEPGLAFYRYAHRVQAMLQAGSMRVDDLGVSYTIGEDSDALPYSSFINNVEATAEGKVRVKSSGREYSLLCLAPETAARASKPWDGVEAQVFAVVDKLRRGGVAICADGDKRKALKSKGIDPVFEVADVADPLLVIANARELNGTAFWFVANIDTAAVDCRVSLRLLPGSGDRLELWDAETGDKKMLAGFEIADGVAAGRLHLERESSAFIVCRPKGEPAPELPASSSAAMPLRETIRVGTNGWTLEFAPGWGAPEGKIPVDGLKSWTEFDDSGIKHFSGTATYETEVAVPRTGTYELDLGEVRDIAEVLVDGKAVATLWHRPYRREIALEAGSHLLAVKVTNAWTNRMIGDESEPDDCVLAPDMCGFDDSKNKRFVAIGKPVVEIPEALRASGERKVRRYTFSSWRYILSEADLRPAGLIGPVALRIERQASASYDVGVISDSHWSGAEYYADDDARSGIAEYQAEWLEKEAPNLRRAAAICSAEPAARFVVHTGDLIEGSSGSLERQVAQLRDGWERTRGEFPVGVPFIPVNGNHETYDFDAPGAYAYAGYEQTLQRYSADEIGRVGPIDRHFAFRYGPDLYVFYDSNADEYEFLRRALEANPDARYVFAVGHIPAINPCEGGIEIDSPWAGNTMEDHNRFLRLLQSRDAILLCGDTHRLGMVDYVTGEGRLTELMGVSVFNNPGPYRELAASPAEFPINWNSCYQPGGVISERQQFLKGGLVRFWGACGAGFWKLHVSDASVTADLYTWDREGIVKTVVLRGAEAACAPVSVEVAEPLSSGPNRLKVSIPADRMEPLANVTWRVGLPVGWKAAPFDPGSGVLEVTLPNRARPFREEASVKLYATDNGTGRVVANEDRHFLQQDGFSMRGGGRETAVLPPVIEGGIGGFSWPQGCRYAAVPPDFADEGELWKRGDLLELFFDVKNLRKTHIDGDTAQVVVMRIEDDESRKGDAAYRYRALVIRDGGKTRRWASLAGSDSGPCVPWSLVAPTDDPGYIPKSGVIGMDAAFNGVPLMGGKEKNHADPSTWGRVRLISAD